jgi:endoglucanase
MRFSIKILLILISSLICLQNSDAQQDTKFHSWWNDRYMGFPDKNPDAKKLPLIRVKENKFVDEEGKRVLFRGLSISDPDKIEHQGHWNKEHFRKIKEMGATLIRIPVHPVSWRERTPGNYIKLLDQAVEWATELGIYLIIDWHSIGNLKMELFQDPMYNTTQKETFEFWRDIARHFKGNNTVAFYELFNEPTTYYGQLGRVSWSDWKKLNEDMIAIIRGFDKEKIPLIAGFDWAYDLTPLLLEPVQAEGIGYVTHPYSGKRSQPWESKWENDFGFAADKYPVIATEFGFGGGKKLKPDTSNYGERIIKYLEGKGISWCVWVFDPEWGPRLLESWDPYKLTESGEFFKEAMLNNRTKN